VIGRRHLNDPNFAPAVALGIEHGVRDLLGRAIFLGPAPEGEGLSGAQNDARLGVELGREIAD
jgi:hypothetical protein